MKIPKSRRVGQKLQRFWHFFFSRHLPVPIILSPPAPPPSPPPPPATPPPPGTCDGGIFTYEKTTGHFLRTGLQEPLEMQGSSPGITLRCADLCSAAGSDCPAFAVDYSGGRCFKLDRNTQVGSCILLVLLRYPTGHLDVLELLNVLK